MIQSLKSDELKAIYKDLQNKDVKIQISASKSLAKLVKKYFRSKTSKKSQNSSNLVEEIHYMIQDLLKDTKNEEYRIGAMYAIGALIHLDYPDPKKMFNFSNYIRNTLTLPGKLPTLELVARTLGYLAKQCARTLKTIAAEWIEFETKRAIEWLQQKDDGFRCFVAVCVLKEIALNAPSLFYPFVSEFFKHIWNAVFEISPVVREVSIYCFRAVLSIITIRSSDSRNEWFKTIMKKVKEGFKSEKTESNHGALLMTSELLSHPNPSIFGDVDDLIPTALEFITSKDSIIKTALINLIPIMARFNTKRFTEKYLDVSMKFLLSSPIDRGETFISLGELTLEISKEYPVQFITLKPNDDFPVEEVNPIIFDLKKSEPIKTDSPTSRNPPSLSGTPIVRTLSNLKEGRRSSDAPSSLRLLTPKPSDLPPVQNLVTIQEQDVKIKIDKNPNSQPMIKYIKPMISLIRESITHKKGKNMLPEPLIALGMICKAQGNIMYEHVLSLLGQLLKGGINPILVSTLSNIVEYIPKLLTPIQERILDEISHVLARSSLHQLNKNVFLTSLGDEDNQEKVIIALRSLREFNTEGIDLVEFIKECVIRYMDDENTKVRIESAITSSQFAKRDGYESIIGEVVERLLILGITDQTPIVRLTALSSIHPKFDQYLTTSPNLPSLFISLNEEMFKVRQVAISLIGRLSSFFPSLFLPPLRKLLLQLLTKLEFSKEPKAKEEVLLYLGNLIVASPRMISPYSQNILEILLKRIKEEDTNVSAYAFETAGKLYQSTKKGELTNFKKNLIESIISVLKEKGSKKKKSAIICLGQLISFTGMVIQPYFDYQELLDLLLSILQKESDSSLRIETIKVMGYLGALDPHAYKSNVDSISKQHSEINGIIPGIEISYENYNPTIALNSLVKILNDTSLSMHHEATTQCIMYIMTNLNARSQHFIHHVIDPFLNFLLNSHDENMRIQMLQNICSIVSISKKKISRHAEKIVSIILEIWKENIPECIRLIEELSIAMKDEFCVHLAKVLPLLLDILETDEINSLNVIQAIIIFKSNISDYLDLVIPSLLKVIETSQNMQLKMGSCKAICELSLSINIAEFSARIIHTLCRSFSQKDLHNSIMETLCALIVHLKMDYVIFIPVVNKNLIYFQIQNKKYDDLVNDLLENKQLTKNSDRSVLNEDDKDEPVEVKKMYVNQNSLKKSWYSLQRSTLEDWYDWMRMFTIGLLTESPSPELRSCASLAQLYHPLAQELFNSAFFSVWNELEDETANDLISSLEFALSSSSLPPDILQTLLNLFEFMQHQEDPLPIKISILGDLSSKVGAFAKALHHKEIEYLDNSSVVGELIPIYHHLEQHQSAMGLMNSLQKEKKFDIKESWYELLSKWNEACDYYEKKRTLDKETQLGHLKCLQKLQKWDRLLYLCTDSLGKSSETLKPSISTYGLIACFKLQKWEEMKQFFDHSPSKNFYKALYSINFNDFNEANKLIELERIQLDDEIVAVINEGYLRSYRLIVKAQELSEMEEIILFKQSNQEEKSFILEKWKTRIQGMQRSPEVWSEVLSIHSLAIQQKEELDNYLSFSKLCRDSNKFDLANEIVTKIIKQLGINPFKKESVLVEEITKHNPYLAYEYILLHPIEKETLLKQFVHQIKDEKLLSKCFKNLGILATDIKEQYKFLQQSIEIDPERAQSWHDYALVLSKLLKNSPKDYLKDTIHAFFKSISLQSDNIEDILRLLAIFFEYGNEPNIDLYFLNGLPLIKVDEWLKVITQLIARINSPCETIRRIVQDLLIDIGKSHPLALTYPLTLSAKSKDPLRRETAEKILNSLRKRYSRYVDESLLISQELIRIAILWTELFYETLEDAYKYFQKKNYSEMLKLLEGLQKTVETAETLSEISFQQTYGRDFQEAWEWCQSFIETENFADLTQAWEIYYIISNKIQQQINTMKTIDLKYVSEKLYSFKDLEINVPGTYEPGKDIVKIHSFHHHLEIIESKQKPRKLNIKSNDGKTYQFLLKGHEDLRQDERVMQLFDLINKLFLNHRETSSLNITRYSVLVLSPNVGLIGWVPNTETIHTVVNKYRQSRDISLNLEYLILKNETSNYDNLSFYQKLELFEYVLSNTSGQDIHRSLWLNSRNSEIWLEKRINYTKSLAVMSMVGYLLGLGDRHPRNLMMDEFSGKIIHVDFGDCFEVAISREHYPEKVPFRLTRMLINAMEVCGIEGNFRFTCENVMEVMRKHKDPLMAMLEAFIHDPLANWRLFEIGKDDEKMPKIIERIESKLIGTDFENCQNSVSNQVSKLIEEATSSFNLSQCYIGWCAYW